VLTKYFGAIFIVVSLFGLACTQGPFGLTWSGEHLLTESDSVASQKLNNAYKEQAMRILSQNCTTCHGSSSGRGNIFGLTDLVHLVSARLVAPGHPEKSLLFMQVETATMPPGQPLAPTDVETLRSWITETSSSEGPSQTPDPTRDPNATPTPAPMPIQPTFQSLRTGVFQAKCVACHSATNASGGYAFDSYTSVLKAIDLANPAQSKVYVLTASGAMPRGSFPALVPAEEAALLQWIESGAIEN
jgi:mono/diheme cytochrome c family protein